MRKFSKQKSSPPMLSNPDVVTAAQVTLFSPHKKACGNTAYCFSKKTSNYLFLDIWVVSTTKVISL